MTIILDRKEEVSSQLWVFFLFCPYKNAIIRLFLPTTSLVVFILPQGHNVLSSSSSSSSSSSLSLLSHGLGSSVYDILFFLSTECETSREA
jgi:hypothetical protein